MGGIPNGETILIRQDSLAASVRSLGVAVPKERAEEVRKALQAAGHLRTGVPIERDGDTVFIPVQGNVSEPYPIVEREFRDARAPIRSYHDVADVPPNLKPLLPRSFDVVGDIALIKVPDGLTPFETEIAAAILRANSAVKVVAVDEGVKGEHRVRRLRVVAGPKRTETIHREYGLSFKVDVARAYFSPRLGTERMRVAAQVEPGEAVADLFAGVGPYAILIATRRRPRIVYAFDANPDAFRHLEENVRRNRAVQVEPRLGDAGTLLATIEPPDRVIVDYPQDPDPAYRAALSRVLPNGTIHYYAILDATQCALRKEDLVATARSFDRGAAIASVSEVHGWSPTKKLYAFDVRIT